MSPRLRAILQALLVTFVWSSSWPLIKIGLQDLPPLTFAGSRYALAAVTLWVVTAGRAWSARAQPESRPARPVQIGLVAVGLLGILQFAVPPAAQYVGLSVLPATDVSLILNFIPVSTAIVSAILLRELPTWGQVAGVLVALAASLAYFYPFSFTPEETLGVAVNVGGVMAVALSGVIIRGYMREGNTSSLWLTRNMITAGGVVLLASGLLTEGISAPTLRAAGIIVLLATVNTAFTFTLWNHVMRVLTAVEVSIIANSMLVQIALLSWLTLGERPTPFQAVMLVVVAASMVWVQFVGSRRSGRARGLAAGGEAAS